MTDEFKPLIVDGERVGEYSDTCIDFDKGCMATIELWNSPKQYDAYQYEWEAFKEFYKPDNDEYKYVDYDDEEFTPGMNGIDTRDVEKWLLELVNKNDWIKDEIYFIVNWRRYAIYMKEERSDGEYEWCLYDLGDASYPDRCYYKNGKIEGNWETPMEEEE